MRFSYRAPLDPEHHLARSVLPRERFRSFGPTQKWRPALLISGYGGIADSFYSLRDLPGLTPSRLHSSILRPSKADFIEKTKGAAAVNSPPTSCRAMRAKAASRSLVLATFRTSRLRSCA